MHNVSFLKNIWFSFLCMSALPACTSLCLLYAVSEEAGKDHGDAEEDMELVGSGVTESCEVPCGWRS